MASNEIIAVIGATGAQGGGLARAILNDPDAAFRLRAVTRNPDSDKARALADEGAEVVQADLDDVESLVAAFQGAYGAFCVTNFWEHFSPEKEKEQARNMAEAARRAGLQHVIWSTLDDTREQVPLEDDRMPTLMERYKVPHFDAKGEADRFFTEAGVPTTFLVASFYWDNLVHFGMEPKRGEDGVLELVLPMADRKLPGIAAGDIGRAAHGILKAGASLIGKTVGISGEHATGARMAEVLGEVLGEEVRYVPVPPATYRAFGFPGAEDLGNMFQYKTEFEEAYCAARPVEGTRALAPGARDFAGWARENADRIPVAARG